ncbi:MAG: hypothetical protein WBB89_00535, partial [Candidatus Acidiferrum sp.]
MKIFSLIRRQMAPLFALRYLFLERPNRKEPAMSRKIQFVCLFLLLGLLSTSAQSGFAQSTNGPLNFGNNFFVTGDYVVAGAQGLNTNFANDGTTKGTINIPDANPGVQPGITSTCTVIINGQPQTKTNCVPAGAQIVAALLYWQTVEKVGQPGSGKKGFFRPLNGGPQTGYSMTGVAVNSHNATSFSFGQCSGSSTGKNVQTYRADVRGFLPQDKDGNVLANGTYEVRLPSVGPSTPLTLGATLVIIYRILSPDVPLNSIVIYEGGFANTNASSNMTQTVQGFYKAADAPVSRLTHIVAGGKNYRFENVYLNDLTKPLPALYASGQPFPGYYGTPSTYGWDNTTWTFPSSSNPVGVAPGAASATTMVAPSSSQGECVSWGAVVVSTTVKNSDGDGLLDVWKAPPVSSNNPTGRPGYCDASFKDASLNEGKCNAGDANWVDLPGAVLGTTGNPHKDVFVQLDYMCSSVAGPDSCNTGPGNYSFDPRIRTDADGKNPVQKVKEAYAAHGITLHVNEQGNQPNVHAIPETIPEATCTDKPNASPPVLCSFPGQAGVVAWKGGLGFFKNQLIHTDGTLCTGPNDTMTCIPRFQHGAKDSKHYALFAHAVGRTKWKLQDKTLTSVVASGNTVTFTTSTDHGLAVNPSSGNDRVTVVDAITNLNLNGPFYVRSVSNNNKTFTICIANATTCTVNATKVNYTLLTDPNLAVAPGQTGTSSGYSDVGGADSLIALGRWGNPAFDGSTPATSPASDGQKPPVIAGTFMHELGHSIGLTHGGFYYDKLTPTVKDYTPISEANCKSNFQSVMNYLFQVDLLGNGTLDYSGQVLNTLDESTAKLSNPFAGLFPTGLTPTYLTTSWYIPTVVGTPATLHCDGTPIPVPLPPGATPMSRVTGLTTSLLWTANQDINFDGLIETAAISSPPYSLRGYKDWAPTFAANGVLISPGVDLRQIGATGSVSVAAGNGFNGGGNGFNGGGNGFNGGGNGFNGGGNGFNGGGNGFNGGGNGFNGGGNGFN